LVTSSFNNTTKNFHLCSVVSYLLNNWVVKHHAPQSPVYLSGGVPDYQYSLDSPRKKEKISAGDFRGSEYEVRVEKKRGRQRK
jgi:hypothetical protein